MYCSSQKTTGPTHLYPVEDVCARSIKAMLPELLALVEHKACLELVVHQSPDLRLGSCVRNTWRQDTHRKRGAGVSAVAFGELFHYIK